MPTIFVLLLIACGLLAASNLILATRPEAKVVFDKVAPYSGGMGIVLLVISILYLLKYTLPNLTTLLGSLNGWLWLATVAVAILLGFLFGFGLLARLIGGKSPAAIEKADRLRARLVGVQIPLGIAGVALGIYGLI
jgi:hypothetical protein